MPPKEPVLGIAIGPAHEAEGGGDHAEHDDKHELVRKLADAFGVQLDPAQEEKACEALGAFIDSHDEEVDRKGEEAEDEEEEAPDSEEMPERLGGRY